MCDRNNHDNGNMSRKKTDNFIITIVLTLALCAWHQIAFGAYAIHVSSYRSGENASVEASELRAGGLDAFTRYESVPGKGMWYRVYIGNFPTQSQAMATGKALKSRGVISYYSVNAVSRPITAAAAAATQTGQFDTLLPPPSETAPVNQSYPLPPPNNVAPNQMGQYPNQAQTRDPFAEIPPNVRNQLGGGEEACPLPGGEEIIYEDQEKGAATTGFTLGFRTGATFWPNTDNFSVTDPGWQTHRIRKPQAMNIQLVPTYRFNDTVAVESTVEKEFGPGMDFTYLSIGPKFYLNAAEHVEPYARGGVSYGIVDWKELPGRLKPAWGWDLGLGIEFPFDKFRFGMDFMYRGITYKYELPDDPTGYRATQEKLDFSGYHVSGYFGYTF